VDRIVVVTGGSRGIGRAVATRFVEDGDDVVITGRDEEQLAKVASEIGARAQRCDATVPADESVTGWVVEAVPRRAAGGAPGCTIVIRDVLGNEYRVTLAKREPQTFG